MLESSTWTVKVDLLTLDGVPVITPVPLFSVKPAGRDPMVVNVYSPLPPVATTPALYDSPTEPFGRRLEVIANGIGLGVIVIDRSAAAVWRGVLESFT